MSKTTLLMESGDTGRTERTSRAHTRPSRPTGVPSPLPAWLAAAALVLAGTLEPAWRDPALIALLILPPVLATNRRTGAFAAGTLAVALLMDTLPAQIAMVLLSLVVAAAEWFAERRRRMIISRRSQRDRYPSLLEGASALAAARDPEQVAAICLETLERIVPDADDFGIFLGTPEHGRLWRRDGQPGRCCPNSDLVYCLRLQQLHIIRHGPQSQLLVPMRGEELTDGITDTRDGMRNSLNGALIITLRGRDETAALQPLLAGLGRQAGCALSAVNLLEEVRAHALRDDLTGLLGRREFDRRLHEQVTWSQRSGSDLGLIMCDLDHLKAVNDHHGHATGDAVIRRVGDAIAETVPVHAIACRYGGEEFAVLLPDAGAQLTAAIATDIHAAVARVQEPVAVSISAGWSILQNDETPAELFARVDAACYRAKGLGRDRVVAADGEAPAEFAS